MFKLVLTSVVTACIAAMLVVALLRLLGLEPQPAIIAAFTASVTAVSAATATRCRRVKSV